jgi:hypothetical protein
MIEISVIGVGVGERKRSRHRSKCYGIMARTAKQANKQEMKEEEKKCQKTGTRLDT